jgi:hypothetical protein
MNVADIEAAVSLDSITPRMRMASPTEGGYRVGKRVLVWEIARAFFEFVLYACAVGLPFGIAVADLYFAYDGGSCETRSNGAGVTIATWLQVDGFVIAIISLLGCLSLCFRPTLVLMACLGPQLALLVLLFLFAWTCLGAVIFWHYLAPLGMCSTPLSHYMWSRLVLGFVAFVSALGAIKCCI